MGWLVVFIFFGFVNDFVWLKKLFLVSYLDGFFLLKMMELKIELLRVWRVMIFLFCCLSVFSIIYVFRVLVLIFFGIGVVMI